MGRLVTLHSKDPELDKLPEVRAYLDELADILDLDGLYKKMSHDLVVFGNVRWDSEEGPWGR